MLKSPTDKRDFIIKDTSDETTIIPKELDLRKFLPSIRDQGPSAMCTSYSCCVIKSYHEFKDTGYIGKFNPDFIHEKRSIKTIPGMYGRDAMKILQKYGALKHFDYISGRRSDKYAAEYKIKNYYHITNIKELKLALNKFGPCLWCGPMYNKNSIKMWEPENGHTVTKGHTMSIVGYNNEGFILRNSFGTGWGDNGYCIFPYEHWHMKWDIWACSDIDTKKKTSGLENLLAMLSSFCGR